MTLPIRPNKRCTVIISLDVQNDLVPLSADVEKRKVLDNLAPQRPVDSRPSAA